MPKLTPHPNRVEFVGVLAVVDAPSDKPPAGARGHQVVLTKVAVETCLPTLLGMGLNYDPSFKKHDLRRKVGIITEANIQENGEVSVKGYLFARDFPEVVDALRDGSDLGMSYELADARVANVCSKHWEITHCIFTGASIIRQGKAAYKHTNIRLLEDSHA